MSARSKGDRPYVYASGALRFQRALYPIAFTSSTGKEGHMLYISSQQDPFGKCQALSYSVPTLEKFSTQALQMAAAEEALKSFAPGGKNSWDNKKLITLKT